MANAQLTQGPANLRQIALSTLPPALRGQKSSANPGPCRVRQTTHVPRSSRAARGSSTSCLPHPPGSPSRSSSSRRPTSRSGRRWPQRNCQSAMVEHENSSIPGIGRRTVGVASSSHSVIYPHLRPLAQRRRRLFRQADKATLKRGVFRSIVGLQTAIAGKAPHFASRHE